jgi:hypothetical protein
LITDQTPPPAFLDMLSASGTKLEVVPSTIRYRSRPEHASLANGALPPCKDDPLNAALVPVI